MLRSSLLIACAVLFPFLGTAQRRTVDPHSEQAGTPLACGSDEVRRARQAQDPQEAQRASALDHAVKAWVQAHTGQQRSALTIPVVVHIIHDNGPENISDAQVLQGIQDLNDAFANTGAYHTADGVDVGIRFCLAQQIVPNVGLYGITRFVSPLTDVELEGEDAALKGLDNWLPDQFLNIWLVREITSASMGAGVAGYATFPSSHGSLQDGIVNEARWFGSSTDNSKVHIHEVGHYLGLYHTFEGGCTNNDCLSDGDHVCDTPPDGTTAPMPCAAPGNSCTTDADDLSTNNPFRPVALGGTGDRADLLADYMDYGQQACQHLFTAGQADRMNAMLTTARASLLTSVGCETPCPGFPDLGFFVPADTLLSGQAYTLTNLTSTSPLSHTFEWWVDGVAVSTDHDLTWTFSGIGPHTVLLRVHNTDAGCSAESRRTVLVRCGAQATFTLSPPAPAPGQPVTMTATGTGITGQQWFVDHALLGTGASFTTLLTEPGGHSVQLVVQGGGCRDTSNYAYLPVGDCFTGAANNWIIAGGDVVSFNGGGPVSIGSPSDPYYGFEGVSSISDRNGNLLFRTDGMTVIGTGNDTIATGLLGGGSSTQAALIVPKPGSATIYYVFTTDDGSQVNNGAFAYTEVDMSLNNGRGGVVQQNHVLHDFTSEKLTAVRSCNGQDIWVIGTVRDQFTFKSYRVSAAGVASTPVESTLEPPLGGVQAYNQGVLRGSPKGNKLAAVFVGPPGTAFLFDFDNATGIVTNALDLGHPGAAYLYGAEFSPDGSKLYLNNEDEFFGTQNFIYQFDLSSAQPATIRNSATLIGTSRCTWAMGALQLGPNGRIYVLLGGVPYLGEIRYPDLAGTACTYVDFAIPLNRTTNGFGISSFVPAVADQAVPMITGPAHVCPQAGHVTYSVSCPGSNPFIQHHGINTLLSSENGTIVMDFHTAGVDTLVVATVGCIPGADTLIVSVSGLAVDLGPDTAICTTGHLRLDGGADATQWNWSRISAGRPLTGNDRYFDIDTIGVYTVSVMGIGSCTAFDTIAVTTFPSAFSFDLGPDLHPCYGPVAFHAPPVDAIAYAWTNGATTESTTLTAYWLQIFHFMGLKITRADGCIASDTIHIGPPEDVVVDLGPDGELCAGAIRVLDPGDEPNLSYRWQDGSTGRFFTAYGPGTYSVRAITACADTLTDTIVLTPGVVPSVDLGDDRHLCPFAPFTLTLDDGPTYVWTDGSTGNSFTVDRPGTVIVAATAADGCYATDTLFVEGCVGVATWADALGITVRPNPASDRFLVTVRGSAGRSVELLDALGRRVRMTALIADDRGAHASIDGQDLSNGAYVLRVTSGAPDARLHVVITH